MVAWVAFFARFESDGDFFKLKIKQKKQAYFSQQNPSLALL
jgi:hypothetical protein